MNSDALSKSLKVTISPPKECDNCGWDARCLGVCASIDSVQSEKNRKTDSDTVVSSIASMIAVTFEKATLAGVVPYTSVQTIVNKVRGLFKR